MATGTSPRRRVERWILTRADTPSRRRGLVAGISLACALASLVLCALAYAVSGLRPSHAADIVLAYGLPVLVPLIICPFVVSHLIGMASELHERSAQLEDEVRKRRQAEARLAVLVTTDELTQVPNRRAFFARAGEIANGTGAATVAVVDLDNFKRLNDTLGHAAGDDALRRSGSLMRERIDPHGVVARLGGEEFGIILPGLDLDDAHTVLEDLRGAFAVLRLDLTVSVGASVWAPGREPIDTALGRADAALYRAKQRGRNRVEVATDEDGRGLGSDLAPVARR
jgi:diguanylate cyclase (GGDEF)-like protein